MLKRIKFIKRISFVLIALGFSGFLALYLLPLPPLLEGVSFSKAIYDQEGHLLRLTLSKDEKYRVYTPLSEIAKPLVEATLLQEDQYFYSHFGINPYSLLKAVWQTYGLQSRRVGASTITMQLARLKFGMNSKTPLGKVQQLVRALQIEIHFSKAQILEAYLNLAPYGANIEGVNAASLIYYNHLAKNLRLPEALTLSIIPQNPSKRTSNNPKLQSLRNALYSRWQAKHPQDVLNKELFALPLVMQSIKALPFHAPHFVTYLLAENANKQSTLHTHLDFRAQQIIERVTRLYLARKKPLGVTNASVLLVDTRDMSVKALLGSADFFNNKIAGQVNGVEAKRSPGSTLKPFIYGQALDQGLIHPNTVLKDVPHSFNGYNPENFDYEFLGPIKAKDALVLSRNIPAVYLANLLTNPNLYQFLEKAQISHLKSASHYGLALPLGGAELNLKELVGLYAMLVNEGLWYPIRYLKEESKPQGIRLLSPEASFLVLDMLNSPTKFSSNLPISWKTGTSSGYRDAWTLGSFGPYVLGVWIGDFDNKSNPAFVGKDLAAPLFFELVEAIKQERGPLASLEKNPKHLNLEKVQVCKASGLLPTAFCKDREWTWFIPKTSPIKTDTIFRNVAINPKTGLRTCHIDKNTRFEVFEFWPSDLLAIFKKAGIQRHTPPFFEPDCALSATNGLSPQITSPQTGISYIVRAHAKQTNKIPLSAITDSGIEHVYWFINDRFIAKTKAAQPYLWDAKPGDFVLRIVDDQGLSDVRNISVKMEN